MRSYNPLSVDELGRNAARALMEHPPNDLPPKESFGGGGVYTLHYVGSFSAYAGMSDEMPIYVGKADLPGKRQGRPRTRQQTPALYRRLVRHAESLESAQNLHLHDFRCRWLVLDAVWIGLTEQVLIAEYSPLWNVAVDGFGNNDPGKGRWNQRRSQWDTLHPGRLWATKLQDSLETAADIAAGIEKHRAGRNRHAQKGAS